MKESFKSAEELNKRTKIVQEKIKAGGDDALEAHFEMNKLAEEAENFQYEAEEEKRVLNAENRLKEFLSHLQKISEQDIQNIELTISRNMDSYILKTGKLTVIEGDKIGFLPIVYQRDFSRPMEDKNIIEKATIIVAVKIDGKISIGDIDPIVFIQKYDTGLSEIISAKLQKTARYVDDILVEFKSKGSKKIKTKSNSLGNILSHSKGLT